MATADDTIKEFCEALQTEIKAWNAAALDAKGVNKAFGDSGERIHAMPPENPKAGRDQPIIWIESSGMDGNIYQDKEGRPVGSGGRYIYDASLPATVVLLARGTWQYQHNQLRTWIVSLRQWLEENGANGYCQAFAVGKIEPVALESTKGDEGAMSWQIEVIGIREVTRTVSF